MTTDCHCVERSDPRVKPEGARGWFHTGDLAVMHPDGYVEIKDRAKDIIISGGENISSLEVEEVLYQHPDVIEAAVVARPDVKWGETPQAFVTLKPGATGVTETDIIAWCRTHLAHFKCPRFVTFGSLPKTSTGKSRNSNYASGLGNRLTLPFRSALIETMADGAGYRALFVPATGEHRRPRRWLVRISGSSCGSTQR